MRIGQRYISARYMNQRVQPKRKAEPNQVVGKGGRKKLMGAVPCQRTEENQARYRRHKHLNPRRPELRGAIEASNEGPCQPDYEVKTDLHAEKPKKDCGESRVQKTIANSRPGSRSKNQQRKPYVIPEFVAEAPKRSVRAKHR